MRRKSPRASSPARRSLGSVLPWRPLPLSAARCYWAVLDWQEPLELVPAPSPRRQRLAVLHALPTHWGALRRAARLWPRLAEASSASLARVSRRQRLGCARPATGSPTVWAHHF